MANSIDKKKLAFLRRPKVEKRTGLSRSTIYLRMKNGTFPTPVKLGERSVAWIEEEVSSWIVERIKERDAEANRGIER